MVLSIFGGMAVLAWLVQVAIFLVKRVKLWASLRSFRDDIRYLRPLWWLIDIRNRCELLVKVAEDCVLAVKIVPTVMPSTEYSMQDRVHWDTKLNFLIPFGYGTVLMDFGYRKCVPRHTNFHRYPHAIPVYLLHPHPLAVTFGHRGGRRNRRQGALPESIPVWMDGVLLLDFRTLRSLWDMTSADREKLIRPMS